MWCGWRAPQPGLACCACPIRWSSPRTTQRPREPTASLSLSCSPARRQGFRERAALEPADGDQAPAALDVLGPVAGVSEEQRVVRRGSAAGELVAETRDLGLLVMGARGLGAMRSILLSTAVLRRAHCPVIVCPTRLGAAGGAMLDHTTSATGELATDEPVFRSILCGVNGTRGSQEAARQAAVIGGPRAHVAYLAVTYEVGTGATASATLRHAHGEAAAADARKQARQLGVEAEALTLHAASATDVLLRRAADHDLLVLGAGAGSRAAGIILGSTSTAAVHRAPRPVLLTRRPPRDAAFPETILVVADGTPQADQALRLAIALAEQHGARVAIVAPEAHGSSDRHALAEEAAAVVAATRVEPVALDARGPAPAAICRAADEAGASMVVLGSRGLSGARALGSVSERVAHEARCSVLVVRPSAAG